MTCPSDLRGGLSLSLFGLWKRASMPRWDHHLHRLVRGSARHTCGSRNRISSFFAFAPRASGRGGVSRIGFTICQLLFHAKCCSRRRVRSSSDLGLHCMRRDATASIVSSFLCIASPCRFTSSGFIFPVSNFVGVFCITCRARVVRRSFSAPT